MASEKPRKRARLPSGEASEQEDPILQDLRRILMREKDLEKRFRELNEDKEKRIRDLDGDKATLQQRVDSLQHAQFERTNSMLQWEERLRKGQEDLDNAMQAAQLQTCELERRVLALEDTLREEKNQSAIKQKRCEEVERALQHEKEVSNAYRTRFNSVKSTIVQMSDLDDDRVVPSG